jgi:bifunctional DNase/RNase
MIEVTIDSVRVNLMSPQRLVILREVGADRYLPIWVGPYEAEAITVALQEVEMIRPLTHDLLKNVFTTFNAKVKRIEIVALKEDIFRSSCTRVYSRMPASHRRARSKERGPKPRPRTARNLPAPSGRWAR